MSCIDSYVFLEKNYIRSKSFLEFQVSFMFLYNIYQFFKGLNLHASRYLVLREM